MQENLYPNAAANLSLSNISEAKRKLLQKYLLGELGQDVATPRAITRRTADIPSPLSFAQERLWFLDQLLPESPVFNVPMAVRLPVAIDVAVLRNSLNEIVRRHEALRTTFSSSEGKPVPVIVSNLEVDLPIIDLTSQPQAHRETYAQQLIEEEALRPFDLSKGPLIRASLIKVSAEASIFLITLHHIVSDGWSLVLFFQELSTLYQAFSQRMPSPLAELPFQYGDYALWQREWLDGKILDDQVAYWKEQLSGELPVLELPTDRPRPAVQTYTGARQLLVLPAELTEAIVALGQREGATLFMVLLAAFKVLLYRYTGQEDLIVGSPIANRPQTETESLIGFFLNNLALRTDLTGDPTFRDVIARVRKTALDAYTHQDVPFEKLIEELKPARDLSRTAVFQVYFNLFNFAETIKLPGSTSDITFIDAWLQSEEKLSKFDLTLYAGLQERELKLALVYSADLFDEHSIADLLARFQILIEGIVANADKRIAEYDLSTESDRGDASLRGQGIGLGGTFKSFAREEIEHTIPARFEEQVRNYAKRVAVKSRNHEWSYEELNVRANRIGHAILRHGPAGERQTALLFEHDAPMIAAMLGVLKAGQTYVPLDPSYPNERLTRILQHSQAAVLVTNEKNLARAKDLNDASVTVINVDDLDPAIPTGDPNVTFDPRRLAYILYTSGSTGEPKGVMQTNRNVMHHIRAYTNNLRIRQTDRLTLLSSYCFDAAVMDIYGALLNGAALYPIGLKEEGMAGLSEWLIDQKITIYHSTPTVYRYFISSLEGTGNFPRLRLVVLGGEETKRKDVELYKRHFSDECLLVNGLGPTEATVSLQYFIDKQTKVLGQGIPVGYPVDDTEVSLLDSTGKPSQIRGEILIECEHVALGYWRNANATASAFVTDSNHASSRAYRTGDMGRKLPDGSLVFEGRKDSQIKIRGFRVELREIETVLLEHPAVRESAVIATDHGSEKRLVAYIACKEPLKHISELRDFLREKLPDYMLPATLVELDSLPLTSSGKLNRLALPAPDGLNREPVSAVPKTQVEKLLSGIWSELLETKQFGIHDNFFELGGHSLSAVRLFAKIEKQFGKRLPLATLFQTPTIAQLAAIIERDWTAPWSSLVAIQPAGSRPPFFCVHAVGGNVLEYYDLARHLGEDQPFYGFQSQGLNGRPSHTRIEDMAAHYIEEMRDVQPEGPYLIGGRSLGGIIAFEMASQLRAQNQPVGLLALFDTYPTGYSKLMPNASSLWSKAKRFEKRIASHFSNLSSLEFREKPSYLIEKAKYGPRKFKGLIWRAIYRSYEIQGRPLPRLLRDVKEFNSIAARNYFPRTYDGSVTLFWANADLRASNDLVQGWRALVSGDMNVVEVPGSHLNIIKEPHVRELASKLKISLGEVHSDPTRAAERSDRALPSKAGDEEMRVEPMQKAS